MASSARSNNRRLPERAPSRAARRRGRLLIVEPDPLTRWSMSTYLKRWFDVAATESIEQADGLLGPNPLAALVLTEGLPPEQVGALEQRARRDNPHLITIRTVTGVSGSSPTLALHTKRLEKPFELARLARLLGVPDGEIPE